MEKVYKSKVDWWLKIALALPIAASALAIVLGLAKSQPSSIYIGAATLAFYGLVMFGLILPMSYVIDGEGLRVRSGKMRLQVPWDRLVKVTPSSNPLSSPALSLRRLRVDYKKDGGKDAWVLISPTDREQFVRDLAAASARHRIDGSSELGLVEK